jgi:hypothetical protein
MKKETKELSPKENWILKKLTLEFTKGYSFNKTEDRYEGKIEFTNGENESFSVKLREDMTEPYLKLISQEVVKNAEVLAQRMANSFTNEKKES